MANLLRIVDEYIGLRGQRRVGIVDKNGRVYHVDLIPEQEGPAPEQEAPCEENTEAVEAVHAAYRWRGLYGPSIDDVEFIIEVVRPHIRAEAQREVEEALRAEAKRASEKEWLGKPHKYGMFIRAADWLRDHFASCPFPDDGERSR